MSLFVRRSSHESDAVDRVAIKLSQSTSVRDREKRFARYRITSHFTSRGASRDTEYEDRSKIDVKCINFLLLDVGRKVGFLWLRRRLIRSRVS